MKKTFFLKKTYRTTLKIRVFVECEEEHLNEALNHLLNYNELVDVEKDNFKIVYGGVACQDLIPLSTGSLGPIPVNEIFDVQENLILDDGLKPEL